MASRKRDKKTHAKDQIRDNGELPWAIIYYLTPEGSACLLENGTSEEIKKRGLPRPAIAVITGMRKPWRTAFSDHDYKHVRDLGTEHQQNYPRRLAT
jgi:hypothetical protein